jgi:Spy/CpxP family protein refolding chaperone
MVILVFALAAVALAAQMGQHHGAKAGLYGRGSGHAFGLNLDRGRLARELNLTADQKAQIQQIRQDFLNSTASTREQLKAKKQEMMTLWMADQPDPVAIKSVAMQIHELMGQMIDPAVDHALAAYNVLTPQQKAKLHTIISSHAGAGRGMGMERGGMRMERGRMGK